MPAAPRALDTSSASAAVEREFQLTALDIPYILTLPIIRQNFLNTIENWRCTSRGSARPAWAPCNPCSPFRAGPSTGPPGEVPEVVPTPDPVERTAPSPTDETEVVVPDAEKDAPVTPDVVKDKTPEDKTPEVTEQPDTTPAKPVKDVEKETEKPSVVRVAGAGKDTGANKDTAAIRSLPRVATSN